MVTIDAQGFDWKEQIQVRSIPVPDPFHPSYDALERYNNLVHSWIINSVSPSIAQSIIYKDLASEAWRNLKEGFARVDHIRVADLKYELYQLKQDSLSVTDFYTEMSVLLEELETIVQSLIVHVPFLVRVKLCEMLVYIAKRTMLCAFSEVLMITLQCYDLKYFCLIPCL